MRIFVFFFLSCLSLYATAQPHIRGSIKGIVIDSAANQPLSEATISLTPASDSTDAQFVISDKHGAFAFKSLEPGQLPARPSPSKASTTSANASRSAPQQRTSTQENSS
ncbi:carboxypeptidase-like regulatory domain-containing protein [Puia sp. P3]|uniref:carboxypeptidase-like regulatory domain-containing protein n=1 Tax=Puia sp. P3 TaxID=3423952 RepID=UPI003D66DF07